jgi:hypothetical protein
VGIIVPIVLLAGMAKDQEEGRATVVRSQRMITQRTRPVMSMAKVEQSICCSAPPGNV